MTFHDPESGLLNRNVLEKILERELKRNQRYANDLSLVLIGLGDLDHVIDAFGEQWGAHLFKHAAENVQQMCRDSDTIARFDAGKLAVIMPETESENALNFIARIQRRFKEHPIRIKNRSVSLLMHTGIASTDSGKFTTAQVLLEHAENSLSRAQRAAQENQSHDVRKKFRSKVIPLPVGENKKI